MELCHTRPLFILGANFATNILQNILILCPDQLFEVKTSRKIRPGPNVIWNIQSEWFISTWYVNIGYDIRSSTSYYLVGFNKYGSMTF